MKSENRNFIFARKGLPVTTLLFALTFSVCLGIAPHAYASVEVGDGASAAADAVAVGDSASAKRGAVAVGNEATAEKEGSVAVGASASAEIQSVAVGRNANAEGNNAVAVGDGASADGIAVAIGNRAVASVAAIAMGNRASAKERGSVAIGHYASADLYAVAMGDSASAKEMGSVAVGVAASASQYGSAFGLGANAAGEMATAIGFNAQSEGLAATAIGRDAVSNGDSAISIGQEAEAASKDAIAIGGRALANDELAISIGSDSKAEGYRAVTMGSDAKAYGLASMALGGNATADDGGIAIGYYSNAIDNGVAIGDNSTANGVRAIGLGSWAEAHGYNSASFGAGAYAMGDSALALGSDSRAVGDYSFAAAGGQAIQNSIAIGNSETTSENSIAIGFNSSAGESAVLNRGGISGYSSNMGASAIAIGDSANAQGTNSLAIGSYTYAAAEDATALGNSAMANGWGSLALGSRASVNWGDDYAIAIGDSSAALAAKGIAVGKNAEIQAESAIALGDNAIVSGWNSDSAIAVGKQAGASGLNSLALGSQSGAEGEGAIALGSNAYASGEGALALGYNAMASRPEQNNKFAIAMGYEAESFGEYSTAIGAFSQADSEGGVALGIGSYADREAGAEGFVPSTASTSQREAILATTSTEGAVSIGRAENGLLRQITGLAAGTEDTDAVNVAQLKASHELNQQQIRDLEGLAEAPITFSGDTGSTERKLGEELAVTGDGNIVTTADNEGLSLSLNKDIKLNDGSVTIGNTKMDSSGFTVGAHSFTTGGLVVGDISITESGINAGGNRITNVGEGTEDTDAATVGQVNSAVADIATGVQGDITNITNNISSLEQKHSALANTPITFSGDTGSTERKLGEELAVTGDKNLTTTATSDGLAVSLNKDIALDDGSVTIGQATMSSNGFAIGAYSLANTGFLAGDISITSNGIDAGGTRISNLAEGVADTDAATIGQVNSALGDVTGEIQVDITSITEGLADLEQEHTALANTPITFRGDTGSTDRKLGEELAVMGDENIVTTADDGGLSLSLNKDIQLNGGSVTIGDTKMDSSGFAVGSHSFTAGGLIVGDINITEGGINAGGSRITNVGEGTEDTDAATVGQVNDAVADVAGGIQVDITNITEGLAGLEQEHTALANTPITFSGDAGSTERKLGEELAVMGDGNVVTTASDEGLLVGLADNLDLGSNGSLTTGNAVMSSNGFVVGANSLTEAGLVVGSVNITDSGIDAGGTRISNLAEGVADTDAATVGQVKAIEGSLNKGIGFAGDNGAVASLKLGETIEITGGADADETTEGNIAVVADADKGSLEIKLAESVDLGANGSVTTGSTTVSNNGVSVGSNHFGNSGLFVGGITVDAGSNVIRGLSNTVLDPSNMVSGQAATEDQLRAIASILGIAYDGSGNTIEYNGNSYSSLSDVLNDLDWGAVGGSPGNGGGTSDGSWNVADEAGSTEITNGDTVTVAGDANIKVQQSAKENGTGSNVSIELAKDIEVESVTAKNIKAEEVKAESFVVEGGPSMNKDGIDAGGKRITNVARGVEASDAATVGQVNELRGSMDFEFKSMRRDMRMLDHKTRAGIAAAMATASLPQAKRPGESIVSVGGGTWRGETGLAIGLSATSDNGKWTLNLSGNTTSRGDHGAAVGVGYQFR